MSTQDLLDLDWRSAPKTALIMTEIERFITKVDAGGIVPLRLEHSTAADVVRLEQVEGILMLRRRNNLSPRDTGKRIEYWVRLVKTATLLHNMIANRETLKMRFIQYREAGHRENLSLVKQKVVDVALTLQIHPAAFGIQRQGDGTINTPKGVVVETTLVSDIFEWEDRQRSGQGWTQSTRGTKKIGLSGIDVVIPSLVLDIKIKVQSFARIDAVIVTEHRSLSQLEIDNVLMVMTGGFPSSSTKEYLHLLSVHERLQGIPFLCFVDHDMGGFSIFQTLKYGSKNSAWASKTMVCPQLEYMGPTRQDLRNSIRLYRPAWERQFRVDFPYASGEQVTAAAEKWMRSTSTKVTKKFSKSTKKDLETHRSFEKLGWLNFEDLVKREIDWIIAGYKPSKFRIAALTTVDLDYVRFFIETKLSVRCIQRASPRARSPVIRGGYLQHTPSQFSSAPRGAGNAASQGVGTVGGSVE
ncbi:MAG: hypothetical protein Q9182_002833, partial [Xanthomendoza sp. 2 TL-2023]